MVSRAESKQKSNSKNSIKSPQPVNKLSLDLKGESFEVEFEDSLEFLSNGATTKNKSFGQKKSKSKLSIAELRLLLFADDPEE
ncbi:hypothetical protein AYI69_g4982 [Smittium culicis]|uniref:Uncharacterized protein n=1 Tax=Smittium culicis TaxID=133412 RepID=A0A1R1Y9C3_9FUNG|nr:hypothetical protein AYI69_g4982 [Smittium culicis]